MIKFLTELYKLNAVYTIIGIANTALLLFYVGVSQSTDIWFASLIIVTTFAKLFMTGFMNEIFLPKLVRCWPKNSHYAEHLLSNIFTVMGVISVVGVLIIFISSTTIVDVIYPSIAVDIREEIAVMMRWTSPVLLLIIINELLSMTLNSREIYAQPERARIFSSFLNFVIILSLYSKINIWALYASMMISQMVNLVFLVYAVVKNNIKIGIQFRKKTWRAAKIQSKFSVSVFYILITQAYLLLFRSYLSSFPPGMLTVIHYVETIIIKGRSLIMRPISTVTLTDFAKDSQHRSGFGVWLRLLGYFITLSSCFFITGMIVRYYGIYVLLLVLDSQEYYQLIWFRSLLAFYILMIPFEIILVVIRKKLVSQGYFNKFYLFSGLTQVICIALVLFVMNYSINSLNMIYAIVFFDVISKILVGAFYLFTKDFVDLRFWSYFKSQK